MDYKVDIMKEDFLHLKKNKQVVLIYETLTGTKVVRKRDNYAEEIIVNGKKKYVPVSYKDMLALVSKGVIYDK